MSKIKIMGLGGLAETGKNTYIIEVDDSIYIFDCGLKFATENLYGIDYIIPDFEYLVKSKKRIKGLLQQYCKNITKINIIPSTGAKRT